VAGQPTHQHHRHHGLNATLPAVPGLPAGLIIAAPIAATAMGQTHPQVVELWKHPQNLWSLGSANDTTRRYGVIIICSAFAGALGAMPGPVADRAASAVELALALWLCKEQLRRHVERREVKEVLSLLHKSGAGVHRTVSLTKRITSIFKPHPHVAAVHGTLTAVGTFATGVAIDQALRHGNEFAPAGPQTQWHDALRDGRNWDEMVNSPVQRLRDAGAEVTTELGGRRVTLEAVDRASRADRFTLSPATTASQACDALATRVRGCGASDAALAIWDAAGIDPRPSRAPKSPTTGDRVQARGSLMARELIKELKYMNASELRAQLRHERSHKNRKTVIGALERRLSAR
jgi:hypothetical protein